MRWLAKATTLISHHWPDGRAHYYLFSQNVTGLNVSIRIEPARTCTTSEACRDAHWRDRGPHLATAELLDRSERNEFASERIGNRLTADG